MVPNSKIPGAYSIGVTCIDCLVQKKLKHTRAKALSPSTPTKQLQIKASSISRAPTSAQRGLTFSQPLVTPSSQLMLPATASPSPLFLATLLDEPTVPNSSVPSPHPMLAFMGEFLSDSALESTSQSNFAKLIQHRRQPQRQQQQQLAQEQIAEHKPGKYNIKKITDNIFSAAIHAFNPHLRCHITRYVTANECASFTCDSFSCYQFINLEQFLCPHTRAVEAQLATSINLSPIRAFHAEELDNNAAALSNFRMLTGISDETLEKCQHLISIAQIRHQPVIVQVTSLCFSVIVEHVQYWCREGRVFVRQWGPKWICFCGSSIRCEHILSVIYALTINDPEGEVTDAFGFYPCRH